MNPVPAIAAYNIYDRLLGLREIDWNARNLQLLAEQRARAAETARDLETRREKGTQPSRELAAYAGRYDHPAYGSMEVRARQDLLEVVYDGFRLELEHYHYDVFRISFRPAMVPVTGLVTFSTDESGKVTAMAIPFEPNGADIVFERARYRKPRDQAVLDKAIRGWTRESGEAPGWHGATIGQKQGY